MNKLQQNWATFSTAVERFSLYPRRKARWNMRRILSCGYSG